MKIIINAQSNQKVKVKNSFVNFKKLGQEKMTVGQAEARINQLDKAFRLFEKNDSELQDLVTDDSDPYIKDKIYSRFEDYYYNNLEEYKNYIALLTVKIDATQRKVVASANLNFSFLPVIKIPVFSCEYENWENFHEIFRALIRQKPELPPIIKFQQLQTHIIGKALE